MNRFEVLTGCYFDVNGKFAIEWDEPMATFGSFERKQDAYACARWLDSLLLAFCREWNGDDQPLTTAQADQRPCVVERTNAF